MSNISKIIILVIILAVMIICLTGCVSVNMNTQKSVETEEIKECKHEWVITSRYNFFLDKYKTFSKCIKCGKEI